VSSEQVQEIFSQLQELVGKLREAGVDLPANLDTLLLGASPPAGIPFDESQRLASVSAAHPGNTVRSTLFLQPDLADLVGQRISATVDEFTVAPTDKGGQVAGKGFEFQDIYTIFLMTRFLEDDPAVLVRIEGAEDVDLLTRQGGNTCESYYQIKTIREGSNWTLRMFDSEGVWSRFAYCISEFHAKCSDPARSIRVVLVVDGDISDDTRALKDVPQTFAITGRAEGVTLASDPELTEVRGEAFFSMARRYLRASYDDRKVRQNLGSRNTDCAKLLNSLCQSLVRAVDQEYIVGSQELDLENVTAMITRFVEPPARIYDNDSNNEQQTRSVYTLAADLVDALSSIAQAPDHLTALKSCLIKTYSLLDRLFVSLQIESRIGFTIRSNLTDHREVEIEADHAGRFSIDAAAIPPTRPVWHSYLEGEILFRLVKGAYLSPEQARIVYENRLKTFVRRAAQTGELVDQSLFFLIISSMPRIQLEEIPATENLVQRSDLVSEIIGKLRGQSVEYLYGFPKIGKTKLAAMIARELSGTNEIFWHTIEAGVDCADRLVNSFTFFIGELTNSRNLFVDWYERKQSLSAIAEAAAFTLASHSVLIVLDNCHVLSNGQLRTVSDLLQVLVSAPNADVKVLMVGEDRSGLPSFVSSDNARRVGGLSFEESIELLKENKCFIVMDSLPDFLSLHSRTGGHPLMLLIAASKLGETPSAQEVSELAGNLPDLNQDTALFFDQLAHQIFGVLTTDEQKEILRRLSVLHSGFDKDLCWALANCEPALDLKPSDWLRLVSQVLDRTYRGEFVVPGLFQQIASEDVSSELKRRLYAATADHILDSATKERKVDFWDFQDAITYLGLSGRWEEAARYFLGSLAANPLAPYEHLRFLFVLFGGPAFQASNVDPSLRSAIAFNEFNRIIGDSNVSHTSDTLLQILKRMRSAALAIEDEKLRAIQLSAYYAATFSLYEQLLQRHSSDVTDHGAFERESPIVAACSRRLLRRARKAFNYALASEEFKLIWNTFGAILYANYLTIVPSVEEVPGFADKVLLIRTR